MSIKDKEISLGNSKKLIEKEENNEFNEEDNEEKSLIGKEFLKESKVKNKVDYFYKHLKATSFGYVDESEKIIKCKCCSYPVNNKLFSIFDDTDKFSINGSGYSLFFKFISFLIIILIFPFSFLALYDINHNMKGSFCTNFKPKTPIIKIYPDITKKQKSKIKFFMYFYCYSHFVNETGYCEKFFENNCYTNYTETCEKIAIKNYDKNMEGQDCDDSYYYKYSFINSLDIKDDMVYNMLHIFSIFLLYLLFEKFQNYFQNKILFYDQEILSNLDYCLEVSNLNFNMKNYHNYNDFSKDLKKIIKNYLNENNIVEIHPIFNLSSFTTLKNKLIKTKDKINLAEYDNELYGTNNYDLINYYKGRLLENKEKYKIMLEEFYLCKNNYFTGTSLICFNYPKNVYNFIKNCSDDEKSSIFNFGDQIANIRGIKISNTHEPSDIIWSNFHYTNTNKFFRNCFSTFVLIKMTILFFIYILYLKIEDLNDDEEETKLFKNNYFISFMILVSNIFIQKLASYFGKFNKPKSKSEEFSLILKIIYKFNFITFSLISLITAMILFKFYGDDGLILSLNTLFLADLITGPFMEILIDFKELELIFKRLILKYFFDFYPKTVHSVKNIFTKERFKVEIFFSKFMKMTATALFYITMFPPVVFYSLVSMILYYFLYKYVLIQRSHKKINYSSIITSKLIDELEYLLLIFASGMIVKEMLASYINVEPLKLSISSVFCLCFAIFNILTPLEHIDKLFKEELIVEEQEKSYEEMKTLNHESYDSFNPLKGVLGDYNKFFS